MHLKSYFAETVDSAIRQARQELGENALLMNSRKASVEAQHLGAYEVVFAIDDELLLPAPAETAASSMAGDVADKLAGIRRQIDRMAATFQRSAAAVPRGLHPWIEEVFTELVASEVDPDLAVSIVRRLDGPSLAWDPEKTQAALAGEAASFFSVSASLGKIVALVGPPGVGKTTTLVKLAARYGITRRRPIQILSIDAHRVGASDQLRKLAMILGAGFLSVEDVGGLTRSLEEHSQKDLVLIDTAGYGPRDMELATELAQLLSTHPHIDTHLVLSCSMKSSDLSGVVDRYAGFRPTRLLFTKLDETSVYGNMLNEAVRTELPISFLSAGQGVPEDLEPATKSRVLELVLLHGEAGWGPKKLTETPSKPPGMRQKRSFAVA